MRPYERTAFKGMAIVVGEKCPGHAIVAWRANTGETNCWQQQQLLTLQYRMKVFTLKNQVTV